MPPITNKLIDGLSEKSRSLVLNRCKLVSLEVGEILCEPEQRFLYAYFPLSSFISLLALLNARQTLEMGLIGNEGILGSTLVLGVDRSAMQGVVQGAGDALRLTVTDLRQLLQECPDLHRTVANYLFVLMSQLPRSSACIHFHHIKARLARWLLMSHDRAHADHFNITHQDIANILGVRRSGVTVAAGALQKRHLINYSRGEIEILDRKGLEEASCECYSAVKSDYTQMLG